MPLDNTMDDHNKSKALAAALSQIETRKSSPSIAVMWKIAVGLGIPFSWTLVALSCFAMGFATLAGSLLLVPLALPDQPVKGKTEIGEAVRTTALLAG
jgi:transcriptional regulator with XRE-family HTH domain